MLVQQHCICSRRMQDERGFTSFMVNILFPEWSIIYFDHWLTDLAPIPKSAYAWTDMWRAGWFLWMILVWFVSTPNIPFCVKSLGARGNPLASLCFEQLWLLIYQSFQQSMHESVFGFTLLSTKLLVIQLDLWFSGFDIQFRPKDHYIIYARVRFLSSIKEW